MEEEEEELFYDSLEDELPEVLLTNSKSKSETYLQVSKKSKTSEKVKNESRKQKPFNTKIPLFIGETYKEDLKSNPRYNQTILFTSKNKKSTSCISCSNSVQAKINLSKKDVVNKERLQKSYLGIYCQKNKNGDDTDTTKSLYGGGTTNRTFTTLLSSIGMNGPSWDAPSAFEKYIPKTYATQIDPIISNPLEDNTKSYDLVSISSSACFVQSHFMEMELDNLKSASQMHLTTKQDSKKITVTDSKSITQILQPPKIHPHKTQSNFLPSKKTMSPLSLGQGSLKSKPSKCRSVASNNSTMLTLKSPSVDQAKLELIRKQQEYGSRASNRNRVRILLSKNRNKPPGNENT